MKVEGPASSKLTYNKGERSKARNSERVFSFERKTPSIELVTARVFCFSTPRIIMHKWCASMTQAAPNGFKCSLIASAICVVSRSCTCRRRAKQSTRRGILLKPTILLSGI